jgi:hypothetical protein
MRVAGEADQGEPSAFSAGRTLTVDQHPSTSRGGDDKMSSMRPYRLHRRIGLARSWNVAAMALVVVAFGAFASSALAAKVNIVSKTPPSGKAPNGTAYFTTIQAAVNASTGGDYVLIEPGVYDEQVKVTSAQSGIWIRGMNRNTVILDGQNKPGNGIEIYKANNVWVENLTARNFDTGCSGCGNEIWWNGGAESGKIGAHGWYGSYLTAYDTGFNGGYGIFTNNEVEGSWENIYASGFNDSGMYLGACQECKARITGATMENNALGYSGSNSGGKLAIEYSLFRRNSAGVVPNSENPGDAPPPQDGECNRPNIEHPNPEPTITSTDVARCTMIRNDVIIENNNLTVAGTGAAGELWGVGVILPGDSADLVERNIIANNPINGVLGLEYPNPFPPVADTIFFPLTGNRVSSNLFVHNGYDPAYSGSAYTGDVMLTGGYGELFGGPKAHSTNNCVSGNLFTGATFPPKIEGEWGCQNTTTPNPGFGGFGPGGLPETVEYILRDKEESDARSPVDQPAPPPQPTMPNPCTGVPKNPLCR